MIDAEVESINGIEFNKVVAQFPSQCMDKKDPVIREWIANKIIAGKRNEKRKLTIRLKNGAKMQLDVDALELESYTTNLSSEIINDIGYIRINNALGNSELVNEFDTALDGMMNTNALILDLRNTPNGGSTDVAEPILGRFISEAKGYQICENKKERYTRKVFPRKRMYENQVYVLVGRWTGSMGEGMAIGLDGMNRAKIIGTEMNRLAGGIKTIKFSHSNFGFHIPFEKMYHLDGSLRETYVPKEYVNQASSDEDHFLNYAFRMIKSIDK